MKKYISILVVAAMAIFCLSACDRKSSDTSMESMKHSVFDEQKKQIKIVTTIFPVYDWVKEILGNEYSHADITMLLDNGVDLHSYQPTTEDIIKISECDLFIYVGGESDEWAEDVLKEAVNKDMKVINLLETLGNIAKEEELVEGMQAEDEGSGESQDEETPEYDEHVWLSLKNAKILCNAIQNALSEIDANNADTYKKNVQEYAQKLDVLDAKYQSAVDAGAQKTLLFGDRFPFRYLVDDYGLSYYAAFVGCSAETEASFETLTFLTGKADELGLKNIMTIEKSDQKVAKTIIQNTKDKNQQILTLDSMQSTVSGDAENGTTYLSIMEKNLDILKKALQ